MCCLLAQTLISTIMSVLNGEIIIKPTDKGSATVAMSHDDCVAEATRQLTKEDHYLPIDRDPTTKYAGEITKLLAEMKMWKAVDEVTKRLPDTTGGQQGQARFYLLPKIHKLGNPGCPTVLSC